MHSIPNRLSLEGKLEVWLQGGGELCGIFFIVMDAVTVAYVLVYVTSTYGNNISVSLTLHSV